MPKNKTQGIIFGIIMSYAMAYGMEVYNIAIKEGVDLAAPLTHWISGKLFK